MEKQATDGVTDAIISYLTKHSLSGNQFSKRINMNPATWSRIRRGLCPPGGHFLLAVAATFPDLRQTIADYVANGHQDNDV